MSKTAQELTRKEMKGPDRFQTAAADAAAWMAKHEKQLVLGILAIVIVAVVAVGASYVLDTKRAKSGGLLYRAIEAASGEVSRIPLPNFDRPIYKTAEEKEQAVIAAATKVREQAGGTRAAATASRLEADAHLALGEWDKAIAAYQRYLATAPADDSLRFAGLDGLARAHEGRGGKGDLEAATKSYEQASQIGFFKDRATLELSRVLAKAGKTDEAKKALEALPKESLLQAEAQQRLARLAPNR
jgi:tetratricopeptide (TPR) repeat protein